MVSNNICRAFILAVMSVFSSVDIGLDAGDMYFLADICTRFKNKLAKIVFLVYE